MVPQVLNINYAQVTAMSISSQPFTRQASLQRSRPSILSPYDAMCDTKDTQTGLLPHHIDPDPLRVKPSMRPKSAPPRDCQSSAAVLAKQDAAAFAAKHLATGTWQPQQCISSKAEGLAKQAYGLLPALASKLAGRLQHKKEELQSLTSCSSPLIAALQGHLVPHFETSEKHEADVHMQSKLHPRPACASKASDAFADAMADAAQLTADLAACRNGQDVGKDKDHLAAAAKETALKVSCCIAILLSSAQCRTLPNDRSRLVTRDCILEHSSVMPPHLRHCILLCTCAWFHQ